MWQYEIMPLLEDLFYGQRDLAEAYGLESLRKAVASAPLRLSRERHRARRARAGAELPLTAEAGRALASSGVVYRRPVPVPAGVWLVGAARKVGAARIGDVEMRIRPKVEIARLLFLLGYAEHGAAWQQDTVPVTTARPRPGRRPGAVAADRTGHPPGPASRIRRR